jgi:hypothetical protein
MKTFVRKLVIAIAIYLQEHLLYRFEGWVLVLINVANLVQSFQSDKKLFVGEISVPVTILHLRVETIIIDLLLNTKLDREINYVKLENKFEFLVRLATAGDGICDQEFIEIQVAV